MNSSLNLSSPSIDNPVYLVCIDFSEASNKAVEYAMLFARTHEGHVHLFHVIDPDEIADSGNMFVVTRSIERLIRSARKRMQSYREMMWEIYRCPVGYEVVIGHVGVRLLDEIEKVQPEAVFIGRDASNTRLLKKLLPSVSKPVFVIPAETDVRIPAHIVFATDLKPLNTPMPGLLLALSANSPASVSVLHVQVEMTEVPNMKEWIDQFTNRYGVNTVFLQEQNADSLSGILTHLRLNCADLVCLVRRERRSLVRLFTRSVSTGVALRANIPMLVLSDRNSRSRV